MNISKIGCLFWDFACGMRVLEGSRGPITDRIVWLEGIYDELLRTFVICSEIYGF